MYSNRSKYFLDKFEKATNKRYGTLILNLCPNTMEKGRFIKDEHGEEKSFSLNKSSLIPSMTLMYSQQLNNREMHKVS